MTQLSPISVRDQADTRGTPSPVFERHYSPEELAGAWGLSGDTLRRLFEREPGVMVIERAKGGARRYRTLRIPESVALRVHRRLTNPLTNAHPVSNSRSHER